MWYDSVGLENDIAVSSRVRLARNLAGYPFGERLTEESRREICERLCEIFKGLEGWRITEMDSLNEAERMSMADKHLISREFARSSGVAALISDADESVNIMVPEEDHIRIQSIKPGLDLRGAIASAYEAEELIDGGVELAYSEKYGYLTHCPTNLGTGMRASVMLHLPAYTRSGDIRNLALQLAKLGLTIRGMEGEGSSACAYLYQISNQVTLGVTEDELIERLENVIGQIIRGERTLREKLNRDALREQARRNYGVLMYAQSVSFGELTEMYSAMRLAAAMGELDIPTVKLDELFVSSMPWTVAKECSHNTPAERDRVRGNVIRRVLEGTEIK